MKGTIKNMTYYKKIERDKARQKHIEEMDRIMFKMKNYYFDLNVYKALQIKLLRMEKQLKLYDEIMGYKKEL